MVDLDDLARSIQEAYAPVKKVEPSPAPPVLKKAYAVGGRMRKFT